MLKYYEKEDLYQELLTKIHEVYDTFDKVNSTKRSTYFVNVCINHLYTLMQPYKFEKRKGLPITSIDLSVFADSLDYEEMYANKMTVQEIIKYTRCHKLHRLLLPLIKGDKQIDVAIHNGVSKQYINKIWNEYILELKEVYEDE